MSKAVKVLLIFFVIIAIFALAFYIVWRYFSPVNISDRIPYGVWECEEPHIVLYKGGQNFTDGGTIIINGIEHSFVVLIDTGGGIYFDDSESEEFGRELLLAGNYQVRNNRIIIQLVRRCQEIFGVDEIVLERVGDIPVDSSEAA